MWRAEKLLNTLYRSSYRVIPTHDFSHGIIRGQDGEFVAYKTDDPLFHFLHTQPSRSFKNEQDVSLTPL